MKKMGKVKHMVLVQFKDTITQQEIDQLVKDYAGFVKTIDPNIGFKWGRDVSIENLNQGFTYIFELTFESKEAIADYLSNPTHIQKAKILASKSEKVLTFDYKPTKVNLQSKVMACKL